MRGYAMHLSRAGVLEILQSKFGLKFEFLVNHIAQIGGLVNHIAQIGDLVNHIAQIGDLVNHIAQIGGLNPNLDSSILRTLAHNDA